ncbi:hypothetical protein SDC9_134137 [bioreactor metagenome]|uniref:Uncharacterized protein n=1 Tax=bioreactor metagenome TaxID=1076179 RepID=A0A645DCD3_9ZZZZ
MLAKSSKSLIEPNVIPCTAGDFIPKPLVGELMGNDRPTPSSHRRHGGMLHSASPAKFHVAVFFISIGIRTEILLKHRHDILGVVDVRHCGGVLCGRRIQVVHERERWISHRVV